MAVSRISNASELTLKVSGRLDTTTAPQLEEEVKKLDGVTSLILDFGELEYISSAGLRVVLLAQKTMKDKGSMVVKNVNSSINDIFEITGFSKILTIE